MGVSHLTFNFGPWRQRRNRVNHDDINSAGSHEHVGNLKCLLTGVRL